ncbi:DUF4960 domain-containing protein [Draconibacterium halophilum]|uniref:DUF4960 domain-containing protein n=1 Tax=Draconibacterium halophilum TaxID=2706887 RepID=A0A6C0RJ27_9BACT|nr:DUF4960 domain-containing protein [Draconibacterium halophilum]QIA09161.1 DUF4960 domain-containing protein [Draconibacterium halophilum]
MKKYLIYIILVTFSAGLFYSCEEEYTSTLNLDADVKIQSFSVEGTEGEINEKNKTITVTIESGSNIDLSNISPEVVLPEGAVITPEITSNMDFSNPIDFTIVNGDVYSVYTISVTEQFFIGFLGTATNVSGITEDDQQAAAEWFFANYDNGKYISFDAIKNGEVDLNDFRVLWWYNDSERDLPAIAHDATVLNKMNEYYQNGGNLLFNGYACGYFWTLGRLTNTYNMVIGDGAGFENGDTWAIGATIGAHDMTSHPIYNGITFNQDGDGYQWVPIIGPGYREDHNYVIVEAAGYHGYGNGDENAYAAFTSANKVRWLGVWGGIRDYFMAGVMELLPTDEYQGKAIYQGIGGFEFNQNAAGELNPDGVNPYQSNINLITKNSLNYLSQKK